MAVLAVQMGFASGARSRLGSALRRLPLAGELVVRAVVMAAVVIVVSLTLQFLLYWQRLSSRLAHPALADRHPAQSRPDRLWILPGLVGVVTETRRLIGGGASHQRPFWGPTIVRSASS